MIPDTSTTLMEALARRGHAPDAAWERFARLYDPVVRRFLSIIRRSWPALPKDWDDEIVQQTFLSLVEQFPERRWDRERGSFRNFLFGVVRYKTLSLARSERGISEIPMELDDIDRIARPLSFQAGADSEVAAISAELWRALVESVFAESRFGERSKSVFLKLVNDGVPVAQLAEEYGMTPSAIYTLKNRIQGKLREKLLSVRDDGDLYAALEKLARDLVR